MAKAKIFDYLYIFYMFVFVLHTVNVFINNPTIHYIVGCLAIFMFIISFIGATKLFRILSSTFLIVGAIFYILSNKSFELIPLTFTSNLSLLTLMAMLPWMNSVVKSGRFDQTLNKLLNAKASNLGEVYPRSSFITIVLATFLNLSSIIISQDVLKNNLASQTKTVRDRFISTSTLRAYAIALLWSPLEILVVMSLFITDVELSEVILWVVLISVVLFICDSIWGYFAFRKYPYEQEKVAVINKSEMAKKLIHLLGAFVLFLVLVIFIGDFFNLSFIISVTMLIFPFAFIWAVLMKRVRSFMTIGWPTWKIKTNGMQNFSLLFISLSFFAESMEDTEFLNFITAPFMMFSDYPLIIFVLIQVIFIGLSLFGIHPLATMGLLTSIIISLTSIFNPVSLAIVLITSTLATVTVSTYGLVLQITADNLKLNPYQVTAKNLVFSLLLGGAGSVVAYMLL